ncbi:hypothetical protein JCM11251_006960 [Rhodosporidiobolus azoricus]
MSQPPTPSLLASAHHLTALLHPLTSPPPFPLSSSPTSSVPPAALLHPLGPSSPSDVSGLRTKAQETLSHLRSSLASFSSLALPPPPSDSSFAADPTPTDANSPDKKRERDKYLTLLRDSAQHETTLLSLRSTDASYAQTLLTRRLSPSTTGSTYGGLYAALSPVEEEKGEMLKPLERSGKELGLAGFRDDEGNEDARPERVTLSLGGKVMVVDFEVVRGRDGECEGERVEKVKVAYVPPAPEGADSLVCVSAGQMLLSLLSPSPSSPRAPGEEEEERKREDKHARWRAVRQVLEQLKGLDEATEKTGRDCFKTLTEDLTQAAKEAFPFADVNSTTFPSLLPSSTSPSSASLLPRLLLHASPPARLSASYSSLLTTGSSPPPGVYTATLTLSALLSSPVPTAITVDQDKEKEREEVGYVAVLDPPVPITRETGQAMCEALGIRGVGELGRKGADGTTTGEGAAGVGLEELLFRSAGIDSPAIAGEREWEISFPDSQSASGTPASPLTISFRLAPSPSSSTGSSSPSFLATHLRFSASPPTPLRDHLLPALHLLQAQIRANELVLRVERRSRVEAEGRKRAIDDAGAEAQVGGKKGRKIGGKKGRKEAAEVVTLDDLFNDDLSAPPAALPVYIHLSTPPSLKSSISLPRTPPPPSLTLTFPVPLTSSALPPELRGLPMALSISSLPVSSSSSSSDSTPPYRVEAQAPPAVLDILAPSPSSDDSEMNGGEAGVSTGKKRRIARLEEVLEAGGDLGLAVRWVVRKLS